MTISAFVPKWEPVFARALSLWERVPRIDPHPALRATFSPKEKDPPATWLPIWGSSGHRPPLQLKSSFKSGQPGLDAGVINITADFDAHAADQRRVIRKRH